MNKGKRNLQKNTFEVFEVGPRDGLQNERMILSLAVKLELISRLRVAGLRQIEIGATVRPDRVPQMADTDRLFQRLSPAVKGQYWCLVPNRVGLERALKMGCRKIGLFTAATDSFAERNIGMTVKESLHEFGAVMSELRAFPKVEVRGYVSTAFGCPFEGKVEPMAPLRVMEQLLDLGVEQVSIGDTIGVATPKQVEAVMRVAVREAGVSAIAGHFHNTRGTALANSLRAMDCGVRVLDSSVGGLGGCPFAPGASGNLATEDLVYMLHGMGFHTGIDLERLIQASLWISKKMGRIITSQVALAEVTRLKSPQKKSDKNLLTRKSLELSRDR